MILLTTTYNKIYGIPMEDTLLCQYKNIEHNEVEKIICFYEVNWQLPRDTSLISDPNDVRIRDINDEFKKLLHHDKYYLSLINKRPTFENMFDFSNDYRQDEIFIFLNSDIYFPDWSNIEKVHELDMSDKILVLTRWNILGDLSTKAANQTGGKRIEKDGIEYMTQWRNGCATDCWIFRTPFDFPRNQFTQQLGVFGVDGVANFLLKKFTKVYNPCLDIFTIHKHRFYKVNKYMTIFYEGKRYARHQWVKEKILDVGNRMDLVPFCHLSDITDKDYQIPKINFLQEKQYKKYTQQKITGKKKYDLKKMGKGRVNFQLLS